MTRNNMFRFLGGEVLWCFAPKIIHSFMSVGILTFTVFQHANTQECIEILSV